MKDTQNGKNPDESRNKVSPTVKAAKAPAQVIDSSHMKLMEIRYELESLSYLLCGQGPGAELNGELFGLGVSLQRMYRRLGKVMDDLATLPRN